MQGPPWAEHTIIAEDISPTIEKLIALGLWDDVLKLLYLSYSLDRSMSESKIAQKNKKQTQEANKKKTEELLKRFLVLEEYIHKVDSLWHSEKQPRRLTKKESLEIVFEENKDKIKQI